MNVGYLQFAPEFGSIRENTERTADLLKDCEADLVVLPELFSTGYMFNSRRELLDLAETADESFALGLLRDVAAVEGVYISAGFAELGRNDSVYNSAALVGPEGLKGIYRKYHLFDREKEMFTPGEDAPQVFTIPGARIGMMICFDWLFPEVARILMLQGAQIICHPANLVLPFCQAAMITRSIENGVFTITANRVGSESSGDTFLNFTGRSQVTDPKGNILARASESGQELFAVTLDPSEADEKTLTERNSIIADRRTDLYTLSWKQQDESH